jgi:N-acetylglutamate synthase-like GNAT family acetyltransferase
MREVYLRTNNASETSYFRVYGFKKFHVKRAHLAESLLVQFTGNCSAHNLKKALQKESAATLFTAQ